MQRAKDVDPAEDAMIGDNGGGLTERCYGLMGLGWRVTKKLAVAGAAISSAPMVLPPLFVVSALTLIFSVPSTAFLAWYAATDKLMRFLLPPAPAPLLLLPNAASMISEEEEEGKEGEVTEERVVRAHEPVGPGETAVGTSLASGMGYDVPLEGVEQPGHLPAEITADSAGLHYTGDRPVPGEVEKVEVEEVPVIMIRADGRVEPDELAPLDGAGRGYDDVPKGGGEIDHLPVEITADSAALDYTDKQELQEQVEKGEGEAAPKGVCGRYNVPVDGGEIERLMADSTAVNNAGDLTVPEHVEKGKGKEAPESAGGEYDVHLEGGEEMDHRPYVDSVALDYVCDQPMPGKVAIGEREEASNEARGRYDSPIEGGVDMAHLPAEERADFAALDYAYPAVLDQVKMRDDEDGGRYDVPIEGSVDVPHLPAEERVDSAYLDYGYLAVPEQEKTTEDKEAPEQLSRRYGARVDGGMDVSLLPVEERSELHFPYGGKEDRSPEKGADLAAVPDIHIRENEFARCDQESVLPPTGQEASAEEDVKEPVVVPAGPQTIMQNGRGTREEPAVAKGMVSPVASSLMDASARMAVPAPSQVEGPLMEVPVVMTAAVVGTNAAVVVQQEGLLIEHTPMSEKPVTPTVIPVAAAASVAKEDAQPLFTEETMWEQIEALRMIIGYTVARQASVMEELKALYLFTGVEPPVSYGDPPNLMDIGKQLQFLKSVVGVM